jgi:tol-pal system protein YbgF
MTIRTLHFRSCLAAAAIATLASGPALAQVQARPAGVVAQDRTQERLERVENALRDLQGVVYSVERPAGDRAMADIPPPASGGAGMNADAAVRLNQIEQALAELTGRVEELTYRLEQQQRVLDRLEGMRTPEFGEPSNLPILDDDMNAPFPTDELGSAQGGPTDLIGDGGMPARSGPVVTLPDTPDAAYNLAYDSVLAADYPRAEAALEQFIEKFPDAEQVPEAKYLLGEVYLATGANGDAARVFLDHVSTYRDDRRSPEAYLKLGVAFSRLERTDEACKVFNAGEAKFTDMSERLKRRYESEKGAAGC